MGYRERCYSAFISDYWKHYHSLSFEEYEQTRRIYCLRFKKVLPEDKNAKIIDLACGAGHFLYFLQKEGYKNAEGIDIGKEQIEIAKKLGIENVSQSDVFDYLLSKSKSYDLIVANDIIEHFSKEEIIRFLDAVFNALKPDGKVIISTVNSGSLFGVSILYKDFTHETGFTPTSLMQVMRVCGFKNLNVYGEKPMPYDLRSFIRCFCWWGLKSILRLCKMIETGTGRGFWKEDVIYESRMYVVGEKKS